MSIYPRPLPPTISATIRHGPQEPSALYTSGQPSPNGQSYPMYMIVADYPAILAISKAKDVTVSTQILSSYTRQGAVLATELRLLVAGREAIGLTVLFNIEAIDMEDFWLLATSDEVMIGLVDYSAMLHSVKGIAWNSHNRQAIREFVPLAQAHNAPLLANGSYDFEAATQTFRAVQEEKRRMESNAHLN